MKLSLKITPKLTLVFVLFASVVLVGISLFAYYSGRSALEAAIISDLESTATEKQAALEAWMEEAKLDIGMIASYHNFQETTSTLITSSPNSATARAAHDHLLTTMKKWVGKNRRFLDLFVLAPESGRVIAATDPHEEGRFKEDRLYFVNGKKGPYVQNPYYRISTQAPTMTAAAPIVSAKGRLLAVLAGHLNLNDLNEITLRRTGLHQTDDAFLVNPSHLFVTQPRFISDSAVLQCGIHTEAVNSGLAGRSGVLLDNNYRGIPSIIVYRWLPERQLCLIAEIDLSEAFAPSRAFGRTILLFGGAALLLASAIAFGLARTITRPILKLQAGVMRFGAGELDLRLPGTSRDEIGILSREFSKMATNLAEKETRLRSYTEQLEQMVQERTEDLKKTEERFRIAAESVSDLIWEWDILRGELAWFGKIDEMLGYRPGEFPRAIESWERIIHPDDHDRVMEALERHLEFQERYFEEYRVLRRDGTVFCWTDCGTALWDDEGKPYKMVGSVTDITERKRAEEEIRRLNESLEQRVQERTAQLEAANKEMEAFTYSVSHDLRAPLRAIDGYIQILLEDHTAHLNEDAQSICGNIGEGAQRMGKLIDDLLAFSRLGRAEMKVSPIDMHTLANSIFFELTTPESRESIDFRLQLLPRAEGDPTMVRQIWMNLISNALKFSSKRERPTIEVGWQEGTQETIYSIRDNGAGFDKRYVHRLFGVFERLHSTREFEGTGVGLAIVQRIVHRHGGRSWAEGETDRGATFYFTMPKKGERDE